MEGEQQKHKEHLNSDIPTEGPLSLQLLTSSVIVCVYLLSLSSALPLAQPQAHKKSKMQLKTLKNQMSLIILFVTAGHSSRLFVSKSIC